MAQSRIQQWRWLAALAACSLAAALALDWSAPGGRIDNYHYDWLLRLNPPRNGPQEAVVLEIDDQTLMEHGGSRGFRPMLAKAFRRLAAIGPKAVALDMILADRLEGDEELAAAMAGLPNLVLASDLMPRSLSWQDPNPLFRKQARVVGHVHAEQDRYDGVIRQVQLEKAAGRDRRWALALEAFRVARQAEAILESPEDIRVGDTVIAAARKEGSGRALLIRFRRQELPRISVKRLLENAAEAKMLAGKAVFLGVTSQSEARDKWITPYSGVVPTPGVEIHAHIYETLAGADRLEPASNSFVVLVCVLLAAAAAAIFRFFGGWPTYAAGVLLIVAAHVWPHVAFRQGIVFPLLAPAASAWLAVISCAGYRYFQVRRELQKAEADRKRYRDAIQFVSHEMRSPLTAIQGSSELMTRYKLSDEKRAQIASMIHSESKRMGRMIQAFLDVERLSDGQMELKKDPFSIQDVVILCLERARPLAERKRIAFEPGEIAADEVLGDRELMEYAVYNLLSNAVKYSPPETQVNVEARREGGELRVSVRDQGIGIGKEDLNKIGTRFFRTKRAEASGEMGTGIGLSIVSQIVERHGGRMEVSSAPQQGSCFTLVVPARVTASP